MSSEEAVIRLRRNLLRNYGIKVMYVGVPVLGMRIPRVSVSEFSRSDTDTLYDVLDANMDQLRLSEISTVYVIADADHVQIDPEAFFKPLLGGEDFEVPEVPDVPEPAFLETGGSAFGDLISGDSDTEVLTDNDPIDAAEEEMPEEDVEVVSDGVLEEGIFEIIDEVPESPVVTEENSDAESEIVAGSSFDIAPEVVIEDFSEKKDVPAVQLDSSMLENEPEVLVELTPLEYVPGGEDVPDMPDEVLAEPTDDDTGKVHRELQEDKVVGKILNDFARNSQKKRLASGRLKSGRRAEVLTKSKRGRYVRYRMPGEKITDIAIAPTVRAAAFHAKDGKIEIKKGDIREKVRRRRISSLINIVFDTSGSMDEQEKVQITTSVVIALLKDAYQRRDRVSLVTYSGRSAELVLPFTSSVEAAKRYLEKVPFGGTTPMASGMLRGLETIIKEAKKEPSAVPIMILVTDGTANSPLHLGGNIRREILQVCKQIAKYHVNLLVVDISETGSSLVKEVARESNGSYYHPRSLSKEALYSAIKQERDAKTAFA